MLRLIACGVFLASSAYAVADVAAGFDAALGAEERPAEDRVRDATRKPQQVLDFVGIGAGMSVLDLNASTGWYTEVLAAAVGDRPRLLHAAHLEPRR